MTTIRSLLWVGSSERRGLGYLADAAAFDVAWARDADDATGLPLDAFDALVVDEARATGALQTLERLHAHGLRAPVLVRLDRAQSCDVEALVASGAARVLVDDRGAGSEPAREELLRSLEALSRPVPIGRREATAATGGLARIVTASPAMRPVLELADRATRSHTAVLIGGETGTGKELLARAIHDGSARRAHSFLGVNCAALPETLLESELFGHVRGAFTGADREKKGLFAAAEGGSLFLDEVGEMAPSLQVKLLRVLQEREVRPVGGTRSRRVDVRLIAASNRHLEDEVRKGRFREDLFYRLAVFPIEIPPLRERREDIALLAGHFLARHSKHEGKLGCRFSPEAEHALEVHDWPGNVRELENEVQRSLALADAGQVLGPELLSDRLTGTLRAIEGLTERGETLRRSLARIEAWLIRRALDAHDGRKAATARTLGVTREGLYKKMKRLGIG